MESNATTIVQLNFPAEWRDWRPFASRDILVITKAYKGKEYSCIIDTWNQKWVVAEEYVAVLIQHFDGKKTVAEAVALAMANPTIDQPCDGYLSTIQGLVNEGLIFDNALQHRKSGNPVYNKTEKIGRAHV